MGVVNVLAAVILLSAIGNFYAFFKAGVPTSPLGIVTPTVLVSAILLVVGSELIRRKSWGRTGLLAVIYFSLLSMAYFLVKTFMTVSAGADTSALFGIDQILQWLKTAKIEVGDMVKAIVIVLTLALVTGGVAYLVLKRIFSDDVIDVYGSDDFWFGRELRVSGWDTKPWIIVLLLIGASNLDFAVKTAPQAVAAPATVTDMAAALGKDLQKEANEKKAKEEAAKYEKQKAEDKYRVSYAAFTQASNGLWVVLSTGRLVYYDFASYQAKTFDFKGYYVGEEFLLSLTGKNFYSPVTNQIIRVDTREPVKEAVFSPARVFLGFAKTGHYLLYAKDKTALQMVNIDTGAKVFEIPMGLQLSPEDLTWNPSRTLAFFKFTDKDYVFLNALTGKIQHQKIEFRFPEIVLDDARHNSVIVGGPVGFTKEYKSYIVDVTTLQVQPIGMSKKIVALHPMSDDLLVTENFDLTFIDRTSFKDANPLKMEYRRYVPIPGTETMAVVEDQATHLKLLDLKTGIKIDLSGPFQTGRGANPNQCYLATSLGGQLLFTSCWKQAEVFWVSTLGKAESGVKPQSWRFILPFEETPAASPSPSPSPVGSGPTATPGKNSP